MERGAGEGGEEGRGFGGVLWGGGGVFEEWEMRYVERRGRGGGI